MAAELIVNGSTTTLSSGAGASDTTISIASAVGIITGPNFRVLVDQEIMLVTGVAGTTLTVQRGQEGTTAASHSVNTTVYLYEATATGLKLALPIGGATLRVAASNALYPGRADYLCAGTNDQVAIGNAQSALPAGGGMLEFSEGTYNIGANFSLTTPFRPLAGCRLKPGGGVTLTISGPISAEDWQIFDLSAGGTVAFARGAMREFNLAWWGFLPGNTAVDNGAAFSAACLAVSAVGGVLHVPSGSFPCQDVTAQPYVIIAGAGCQEIDTAHSTILLGQSGHDMLTLPFGSESDFCGFCDFSIHGGRHGIVSPYLSTLVRIARVTVSSHSGAGIQISGAAEQWTVDDLFVNGGNYGVQVVYGLVSGRNFFDKNRFTHVRTAGQAINGWDIQCVESSSVTIDSPVIINSVQHGFHADGGISGMAIHNYNTEGNGNGRSPAATYSTGSIAASSGALTSASSAYQNGDVLTVAGAGVNGADLTTTVTGGGGTTSLTVSPTASTTVTNAAVTNAVYDDFNFTNTHATSIGVRFEGGLTGTAGSNLRYGINGAGANQMRLNGVDGGATAPFYDPNGDSEVLGGSMPVRRLTSASQDSYRSLSLGSATGADARIPTGWGKNWIAALLDSLGNQLGSFGLFQWLKGDSNRTQLMQLTNDGSLTPLRLVGNWQTANPAGATPDVSGCNNVWMRQSGATNVTNFLNGKDGQVIFVRFTDANSTLIHGTNIWLKSLANWNAPANSGIILQLLSGLWQEMGGSA